MKLLRTLLSIILLFMFMGMAAAETGWINNITINEYNISWGYTETFTGMDSIVYKMNLDSQIGNNDSFINAWELLKADKNERNKSKSAIENELDVKINNETSGIELIDVDSSLSEAIIGKTHIPGMIENRFNVTYRLKESIYNSSSIWFMGEPRSPVTVIFPAGIDILDLSEGNETKNIGSQAEVTAYFSNSSNGRGEITINITKNASYMVNYPENNITEVPSPENNETRAKPTSEILKNITGLDIIGTGIIFIVLIYVFKIRKT